MKTPTKKQNYFIIMNNLLTGSNLIFAELKCKHPDAIWTAYKLGEYNRTHKFKVECKKYFLANYGNIENYIF